MKKKYCVIDQIKTSLGKKSSDPLSRCIFVKRADFITIKMSVNTNMSMRIVTPVPCTITITEDTTIAVLKSNVNVKMERLDPEVSQGQRENKGQKGNKGREAFPEKQLSQDVQETQDRLVIVIQDLREVQEKIVP
jgi:hypothetical protein